MMVRFYFPKQDNDGCPTDMDKVKAWFLDTVGGLTLYDGRGVWKNAEGKVYDEPVTIVEILLPSTDAGFATVHELIDVAYWFKTEYKQESVCYAVDGGAVFI